MLEPLSPAHAGQLWQAAQGAEASWTYMSYGPFASESALLALIEDLASRHDPMFWAVRVKASGRASGWLSLMNIEPRHGAIELGNIWFAPLMQRSLAATEAMFLLLRHAADDLGYRRLVWKCDALNAASRRAAERLGFVFEGIHRAHYVVKGRRRDTAWYCLLAEEWPLCRDALIAWLDPANHMPEGKPQRALAALRAELALPRG